MENKAIAVLKKIASDPTNIHEVEKVGDEFYFRYKGHVMSVMCNPKRGSQYGDYSLFIYPDWTDKIKVLSQYPFDGSPDEPKMLSVHCAHFPSQYRSAFEEAFKTVQGTYIEVNLGSVFDDILSEK